MASSDSRGKIGLVDLTPDVKDAIVDIVFVHGFTEDRMATWTKSTIMWPRDILAQDGRMKEARIFTWGYNSDTADSSTKTAQEYTLANAGNLCEELGWHRDMDGTKDRPIIFVMHSLGGLVCEKALLLSKVHSDHVVRSIEQSTRGMLFLGTPHTGASLALSKLTRLTKESRRGHLFGESFNKLDNSMNLEEIGDQFSVLLRTRAANPETEIDVACFYEELPTAVGIIVPKTSATLPRFESQNIPQDHIGMCKYMYEDDIGYRRVSGVLAKWVKTVPSRQDKLGLPGLNTGFTSGNRHPNPLDKRREVDILNVTWKPPASPSDNGPAWRGADLPHGMHDITEQVDEKRYDLRNVDETVWSRKVLFDMSKPSSLGMTRGSQGDWVESRTGEQLMLSMAFQSMVNLSIIQLTSLPPEDSVSVLMRPRTIRLYANTPHIVELDQAKHTYAAQTIILENEDWNSNGTANIGLHSRKFQNIFHLVIFVEEGDGTRKKTRLDRVRLISKEGMLEKAGQSTLKADPVSAEARAKEKHQQQKQEDSTSGRRDPIPELHGLPESLQVALSPFLADEAVRKKFKYQLNELKSNPHLRQESAMNLLNELELLREDDNIGSDAGHHRTSLRPIQIKPKDETKHDNAGDNRQEEKDRSASGPAGDLTAGLHSLSQPFQEALAPFLEDEKSRAQVEQRFRELERNTHLRQASALDLLHVLGSIEETDNEEHEGAQNTTSCGDGDVPGLTAFGNDGTKQGDDSLEPPFSPEDQLSPNDDPAAIDTEAQLQTQTSAEKFFDWSTLQTRLLPAKEDILEKKHLALLAMYDMVKVNVGAQGVSIGLEGVASIIRNFLHKDDYLAFFRSVERKICLPIDPAEEISHQRLENLDLTLFDTSKFNGFDTRLTSVTYNDGKYGTITLFRVTREHRRPSKIRPEAAMRGVPKIVVQKIGEGIKGWRKTTLSMPQDEIWEATKQWKIGPRKPQVSRPDFIQHDGGPGESEIEEALRTALSMDDDMSFHSFNATVPQMVAMLHHKAALMENIESTPVYSEPDGDWRGVRMVQGPDMFGHEYSKPRIIVLAPARGSWAEDKLSWK